MDQVVEPRGHYDSPRGIGGHSESSSGAQEGEELPPVSPAALPGSAADPPQRASSRIASPEPRARANHRHGSRARRDADFPQHLGHGCAHASWEDHRTGHGQPGLGAIGGEHEGDEDAPALGARDSARRASRSSASTHLGLLRQQRPRHRRAHARRHAPWARHAGGRHASGRSR